MSVINLFPSALYVYIIEFDGSVFAFSIDIIFMFDCIIAELESISAIAKYLLLFDMLVVIALVDAKYVLNISLPLSSNVITTVL